MVMTLADVKATLPPKLRGILRQEYGVSVEANKTFVGNLHYTAGSGKLMPDLRFTVSAHGERLVLRYKPGDWELALKKAYDDLVAQSGAFGGLPIKLPEPASDIGKEARPLGDTQPRKNKGLFGRLLEWFFGPED